jgi:DNA helicase-2/ATP-dependent DNA helicase PcrA
MKFSGDPGEDWLEVRRLFKASSCEALQQVADDAKYLRLLHHGSILRSRLDELWRFSGGYAGALAAVREALVQEHFSNATREWRGVHVMTIHKSKGKEFDEVIVYEGAYQHRIVYRKANEKDVQQALRNLRVAVTRAKQRATVLTPQKEPCVFL